MVELYACLVKLGLVDGFPAAAWGWISGHCGVVPFASICPKPSGRRSQFHLPKTNWQIDPIFVHFRWFRWLPEQDHWRTRDAEAFLSTLHLWQHPRSKMGLSDPKRVEPKPGLDPVDLQVASPGDWGTISIETWTCGTTFDSDLHALSSFLLCYSCDYYIYILLFFLPSGSAILPVVPVLHFQLTSVWLLRRSNGTPSALWLSVEPWRDWYLRGSLWSFEDPPEGISWRKQMAFEDGCLVIQLTSLPSDVTKKGRIWTAMFCWAKGVTPCSFCWSSYYVGWIRWPHDHGQGVEG